MTSDVAGAYSATARAWQAGPGRIYDRLADMVCDHAPVPLAGRLVLDLGAGTGAATRAAQRRGADVIAADIAPGMLAIHAATRPPATVGDARALPFAAASFDAVIAAFSFSHLNDPAAAMTEAARVVRPGGGMVVSAYAEDDEHPVKRVIDAVATARGWVEDRWSVALRTETAPRLATVERAMAVAADAGLVGANAANVLMVFPELSAHDLVAWRLGLAHLAPFVAGLPPDERAALTADALDRLGPDPPELVRSVIVLTWRADG